MNKFYSLALLGLSSAFAADVSLSRSEFVANKFLNDGSGGITDCSISSNDNIYIHVEEASLLLVNGVDSIAINSKRPSNCILT